MGYQEWDLGPHPHQATETWAMTWRIRTADKHHMAMRVHRVPRFGSQEIGSITPRQIQAAVDELALKYQP